MEASIIYSLKIWISTLIITPFLVHFGLHLFIEGFKSFDFSLFSDIIPLIFWGGLLSLPFFAISKVIIDIIFEKIPDYSLAKFYVNFIGIIACILPLAIYFLIAGETILILILGIPYCLVLTFAVWICGFKREKMINKRLRSDILDDNFG